MPFVFFIFFYKVFVFDLQIYDENVQNDLQFQSF